MKGSLHKWDIRWVFRTSTILVVPFRVLEISLSISAQQQGLEKIVELYENISTSWEQREFLKPFLEGILFRLGGKMLLGLDFIEACILGGDESYRHGSVEL